MGMNYNALPYKVYVALLTQVDTDAPTGVVINNTLDGVPIFGYTGVGDYTLVLTGAFPQNKTFFTITTSDTYFCSITWVDVNTLRIRTNRQSNGTAQDSNLSSSPIKIEVYL
jgi:hypothetical protein